MTKTLAAASVLFLLAQSQTALAWGQFGHEQINHAATLLLGHDTPVGACLNDASYTVRRYAITPDMEWKTDVQVKNLPEDVYRKRLDDNQFEHSLHFFEADAFAPQTEAPAAIAKLPAGEYPSVIETYKQLLTKYIAHTSEVDPEKVVADAKIPSTNDVVAHGTAPWRVLQLYRLAVDALKSGDEQLAIMYLSTMGHYVGDLSQPFHTTLNYDGAYPKDAATAGIHHEIDTGLLPGSGKKDKDAMSVFSDEIFQSTIEPDVIARAQTKIAASSKTITQNEIIPELMNMVSVGASEVPALLIAYKQQCDIRNSVGSVATATPPVDGANLGPIYCYPVMKKGRSVVKGITRSQEDALNLYTVRLELPVQTDVTIHDMINERLASSAALLARLWLSAYQEAGSPKISGCEKFNVFDENLRGYAIKNYPRPNDPQAHGYMPMDYLTERPYVPHVKPQPANQPTLVGPVSDEGTSIN